MNRVLRWCLAHRLQAVTLWLAVTGVGLSVLAKLAAASAFVAVSAAWIGLSLAATFLVLRRRRLYEQAYFVVALTWPGAQEFVHTTLAAAERFFADAHILRGPVEPVAEVAQLDAENWARLIRLTKEGLSRLCREFGSIHFVSCGYWLWNFALGTEIQDRFRLHIYHFQEGTFHQIWEMSREIKNQKSTSRFDYSLCGPPELKRPGNDKSRVVLILSLGSHIPTEPIMSHCALHLPDVPVWVLSHEQGFDPKQPSQWIEAAAEIAYAIDHLSNAGSREMWLFGTCPAALSLMAGSGVGPYRRVHLMQFLKDKGKYLEVMTLPT